MRSAKLYVSVFCFFTMQTDHLFAGVDNKNSSKTYLECNYMDGNAMMSKIFFIDASNKTVENVAWGGFLNVKTFNDKIVSSSYSDKAMSNDTIINRITGEYNEFITVAGLSAHFTGFCKKIPTPKPLF